MRQNYRKMTGRVLLTTTLSVSGLALAAELLAMLSPVTQAATSQDVARPLEWQDLNKYLVLVA